MRKARTVVAAAACIALASCGGGGGSNDSGIAFRSLGVFQEVQEQVAPAADTLPSADNAPGDAGRVVSLGATLNIPNDINLDGDLDGGFLGMRNDLESQSVNVQGVRVEIFIPGSVLTNPVISDFVPMAVALGPSKVGEGETATNIAFVQTLFVQPDVMAFLNQNQTLLPPTPFTMNVVMTLEAISDNGDSFDSNEFTYAVSIID